MTAIPLADQIAAVRREIAMREQAYPGWVAAARMTQQKADQQIAAMRAVLATLEAVAEELRIEDDLRRNGERFIEEMGGNPF